MNVKIFLENTISIDFATLDPHRGPVGKSLNIDVSFSGKVNDQGMLIDFSIAKSILKTTAALVDHKLLVNSDCIQKETESNLLIKHVFKNENCPLFVFAMHAPKSWVYPVSTSLIEDLSENKFFELAEIFETEIKKQVPNNIEAVSVQFKEVHSGFSYTHTLCQHKGNCQRFHGHSSKITVFESGVPSVNFTNLLMKKLNGLYIISKKYLEKTISTPNLKLLKSECFLKDEFQSFQNNIHCFEYSGSDGKLSLIISKEHVLILPMESTIENITLYLSSQLLNTKNTTVQIYEGSAKGACSL